MLKNTFYKKTIANVLLKMTRIYF